MQGDKTYGDLSGDKLVEFLRGLSDDTDELLESMGPEELEELKEDMRLEEFYGDDAWRKLSHHTVAYHSETRLKAQENLMRAHHERKLRNRERKTLIRREAFNQDLIPLSNPVDKAHLRLLVEVLTRKYTNDMNRYSGYVNKRLTKLLSPLIPHRLRLCRIAYPNAFKQHPGFLYRASKEYGQGLTFWATPDIPYYFEQGTEQGVIEGSDPSLLYAVDKAIAAFNEVREKRKEVEVKSASKLLRSRIKTYFDLLKLDPYWFEALYNEIKHRHGK